MGAATGLRRLHHLRQRPCERSLAWSGGSCYPAARKWDASGDFMELFRLDSGWKTVAANIGVFKIGPGFVQQGKEEDLRLIFSELKRHDIKLALEMGMATRSEHCQETTEAYGGDARFRGATAIAH
jgi:hypothetical protein